MNDGDQQATLDDDWAILNGSSVSNVRGGDGDDDGVRHSVDQVHYRVGLVTFDNVPIQPSWMSLFLGLLQRLARSKSC